MFAAGVGDLVGNTAFVLKMGLLFVAASNAAVLHARGRINTTSLATRLQALLSITLWIAIVASGIPAWQASIREPRALLIAT